MNILVLPKNYCEIEIDEMEYIDGGWDIISVKLAGAIFNVAIAGALGGLGVGAFIATYGRAQARRIMTATVASRLIGVGATKLVIYAAGAVNVALGYLDVGTKIAKYLDSGDYCPNNGYLSI